MLTKESSSNFPKGVGQPAIRAFQAAGYTHWQQFSGVSQAELSKLHGVGPKALRIINQALKNSGKQPLKP